MIRRPEHHPFDRVDAVTWDYEDDADDDGDRWREASTLGEDWLGNKDLLCVGFLSADFYIYVWLICSR